jgi:hypothetical protein
MTADGGLSRGCKGAALIAVYHFIDAALLLCKDLNAGSCQRLNSIGPDMAGDHRTHVFIRQKLSGLDTGTAALSGTSIVKGLKAHIRRINDQKIGTASESGIEG